MTTNGITPAQKIFKKSHYSKNRSLIWSIKQVTNQSIKAVHWENQQRSVKTSCRKIWNYPFEINWKIKVVKKSLVPVFTQTGAGHQSWVGQSSALLQVSATAVFSAAGLQSTLVPSPGQGRILCSPWSAFFWFIWVQLWAFCMLI